LDKDIRLICLDIDGTLLDSSLKLRPNVTAALQRIHARGVEVAIVTGRNLHSTLPVAEELGIRLSIISCSGSHIRTADGRTWETHLQPEQASDIVHWGVAAGSGLFVDRPERSWTTGDREWIRRYSGLTTSLYTADYASTLLLPVSKISIINEVDVVEGLRERIAQRYPDLRLTAPFPNIVDTAPWLGTKGIALQTLGEMIGIPLDQVASMGDSENDLSIFRESGLSIAMGNAPEDVRSAADWVAPSNDDEGVAWAVDRIMGAL
jgi:Cof subfamily protein (haloacid dehalogenase superfamily)